MLWPVLATLFTVCMAQNITVTHLTLTTDQEVELQLTETIEYQLHYTQTAEERLWPSLVQVRADNDSHASLERPILIVARHSHGIVSWQLPYRAAESKLLWETERTLCLYSSINQNENCDDETTNSGGGWLSLRVSWTCSSPAHVHVSVTAQRNAWLSTLQPTAASATLNGPRVFAHAWGSEHHGLRLLFRSDDNRCATVAVYNYTCAEVGTMPHTAEEARSTSGAMRMTVERAGAVTLKRTQYPKGFVIGVLLHADNTACDIDYGIQIDDSEPLIYWGEVTTNVSLPERKTFTIELESTLSVAGYVWGSLATAGLFLLAYGAFGALLLLRRLPAMKPHLASLYSAPIEIEENENNTAEVGATELTHDVGNGAANTETGHQYNTDCVDAGDAASVQVGAARYARTLVLVAIFYALPVLQFVAAFQQVLHWSGSLDVCYYNWRCALPAGALSDINHVLSNLGYVLLGGLFLLQVYARVRRRSKRVHPDGYGLPAQHGLLASLGAALMAVGALSAAYHVCPNRLNFQFDTAFMYAACALSMAKIHAARHPHATAAALNVFGGLAGIYILVVWGVLGGGTIFRSVASVLHVVVILLLSLRLYLPPRLLRQQEGVSVSAVLTATRTAREDRSSRRDLTPRLFALAVTNVANWGLAMWGLLMAPEYASQALFILMANAVLLLSYYVGMKLWWGEKLRWYAWTWLAAGLAIWPPSLYFFVSGTSDWSVTPALSRHLNEDCKVGGWYDAHDLWHLLSATALYCTFNMLMTLDDGLSAKPTKLIPVF